MKNLWEYQDWQCFLAFLSTLNLFVHKRYTKGIQKVYKRYTSSIHQGRAGAFHEHGASILIIFSILVWGSVGFTQVYTSISPPFIYTSIYTSMSVGFTQVYTSISPPFGLQQPAKRERSTRRVLFIEKHSAGLVHVQSIQNSLIIRPPSHAEAWNSSPRPRQAST